MKSHTKRLLTWVISLLLTAGLLYLFLKNANLHEVYQHAREASPGWILAAIGMEAASILLRAWRWRVMLDNIRPRIPLASLLRATAVSFTMSGLVPGRLGELAKPFLLSRWEKLPFGALLVSVVLERGMDVIGLLVLWFVFIFFGTAGVSPDAEEIMAIFTKISYVILAIAVPVGVFLLWLVPRRRVLDRMARRSERLSRYPLIRKVVRKFLGFAEGLGTFRKKRVILYVTLQSVLIWAIIAGAAWAIIKALGLDLPPGASVFLLMCISFGAAIPTPGGIGGVHKAIQLALVTFYGVSEDMGVTAGIVGHAVMFFPGILWGLGYLALGRVHFRELEEVAKEEELLNPGEPIR